MPTLQVVYLKTKIGNELLYKHTDSDKIEGLKHIIKAMQSFLW